MPIKEELHPAILRHFDEGDYKLLDGRVYPFVITNYCPTTLKKVIAAGNANFQDKVLYACQLLSALQLLQSKNIIHRDIKPENIFVNDFGYFKLGDFGIARKMVNITNGLSQKGTFNYIAPEVANSREYDARVDIYSLGIVLYRLLNGNRLPFLDTQPQILDLNERGNAVSRRLNGEILPAPCDASPAMSDIILRACAYEPDMRFSSATEMKNALMSVANGTYKISEGDLDRTKSVHRVAASNVTTSDVNKKAVEPEQKSVLDVNSFDSKAKKRMRSAFRIMKELSGMLQALRGRRIFRRDSFGP